MEQEIERMLAESGRPSRFYLHRRLITAASAVALIINSAVDYSGLLRRAIYEHILFFIDIVPAMMILAMVLLSTAKKENKDWNMGET